MHEEQEATMGPTEESWQNYEQQRRRLNTRLGLLVFALLPLPAILIAAGISPVWMLLIVASLGALLGILYPMWWRTKHHPLRAAAVEARPRRIAWVCRPSGFLCGLAGTLSWSVGGGTAEWVGLAFSAAGALLLCFSYFSDKKAAQSCYTVDVRRAIVEGCSSERTRKSFIFSCHSSLLSWFVVVRTTMIYSYRSATSGSTFVARRAGM